MDSIESIETWYGELRTQKGNTIIIRDDQLPAARTGRMYLYNTDRDAVIEYDETIVGPKIFELSQDEQKQAEVDYGQSWQVAREVFMHLHGKGPAPPPPPEPVVGNINPDEDAILEKED